MPTKQALRAARAYLKRIDGDDYGDPEHGHDVNELAVLIDRVTKLPQLLGSTRPKTERSSTSK